MNSMADNMSDEETEDYLAPRLERFQGMLESSLRTVNAIRDELQRSKSESRRDETRDLFHGLRLQLATFQLELGNAIHAAYAQRTKGYAGQVHLKEVIHRLYEWNLALKHNRERTVFVSRLVQVAELRSVGGGLIIDECLKAFKPVRREIEKFKRLRDCTTGHYDDALEQEALISALDWSAVLHLALATIHFVGDLTRILDFIAKAQPIDRTTLLTLRLQDGLPAK